MKGHMQLQNRTAIVTGAASGIGRGISLALAKRRSNLALADVNEAGLNETRELVGPYGIYATCHKLDVSDAQAVAAFPRVVQSAHPDKRK